MVKDTLAKMLDGRVHALRRVRRADQGQHRQGDRPGRREARAGRPRPVPARRARESDCTYCMHWWAEGINGELPKLTDPAGPLDATPAGRSAGLAHRTDDDPGGDPADAPDRSRPHPRRVGRRAGARDAAGSSSASPASLANDHVDFDLRRRRGARPARRERRRQEHADEHRSPACTGPTRARSGSTAGRSRFRSPRDAIARGPRHGPPALHAGAVPDGDREHAARARSSPGSASAIDRLEARGRAASRERFGLQVDPRAQVWQLSVGEQQRVEILKMLYRGARILIMDEPTAVLAPQEADELFATLRSMTADGQSIVFISHKLERGAGDRRPGHGHAPRARSPPRDCRRRARPGPTWPD